MSDANAVAEGAPKTLLRCGTPKGRSLPKLKGLGRSPLSALKRMLEVRRGPTPKEKEDCPLPAAAVAPNVLLPGGGSREPALPKVGRVFADAYLSAGGKEPKMLVLACSSSRRETMMVSV
jgi:hypothetical protein